ncbi:MAG: MBOAT family protein [Candidatus Schekmanbacteria bacterium]|nr:MBOAT family protein [Candidatus Schekmanbacteria bacterium]
MLFLASLIFYGAWSRRYLLLFMFTMAVDYLAAMGISGTSNRRVAKLLLLLSIASNLTVLGIFKYFNFFAKSFQELMANFGVEVEPFLFDVILPIGISFYTFQAMSYTIDVYRGKIQPCRDVLDYGLYVSFFPQLVAGPIERATHLLPQVLKPRAVTLEKTRRGAYYFMWGLFMKVFVADNLAAIVDPVFAAPPPYNGVTVLLAVYAFSFQIFCDFAGYSAMATGLALAMGVDLMENFRRPYFSKNIASFWRRWHISLSSWFRDYVFMPYYVHVESRPWLRRLPIGLRHSLAFAITLLVTEYLLGLWHGAAWTFGNFGVYHAVLIWLYYQTRKLWDKMPGPLQVFLTYNLVCGGWLIFRANSGEQVLEMGRALLHNFDMAAAPHAGEIAGQIFAYVAILLVVQFFKERTNDSLAVLRWPAPIRLAFIVLVGSLTLVFGDFSDRPFIYFQF